MGHCFGHLHFRRTWLGYIFIISVRLASCLLQNLCDAAVNVVLVFCMGQDLNGLMTGSLGQPMAQIFLNSFGQNGTLVMWTFIILAQYMMGSSTVSFRSCPLIIGLGQLPMMLPIFCSCSLRRARPSPCMLLLCLELCDF